MNSTLKLVLVLAFVTFVFTASSNIQMTPCHETCLTCDSNEEKCAECNICTSCKSEGAIIVNGDFCQCQTPEYRLTKGQNIYCELVGDDEPVPDCEWQLFNQIYNMVVHSNCTLKTDLQGANTVDDVITYDWLRTTDVVQIVEKCEKELKTRLLLAKDCKDYQPLELKYVLSQTDSKMHLSIALIDVYLISSETKVTDRTIYQNICFAIELGHKRRVIREHRFQMRVYTNRDQVEVFHLTVEKQITEGCDKGQECIIVANLDTKGDICEDSKCNSFKIQTIIDPPKYVVNDYLYVRIQFKDNTYIKFLQVITVRFIDDDGIYRYKQNLQWWQIRQSEGSVDVKVLLFQPHVNARVEVSLKITLEKDTLLRNLQASEEVIEQSFKNINVKSAQPQVANAEDGSSFSAQIVCGLFALIAFIL